MGKFPPSPLHNWFSNWHLKNCSPTSHMTDIDRLWVELRGNRLAAVWDIKSPRDSLTWTETIVRDFFELHQVPFYTVTVLNRYPALFMVKRYEYQAIFTSRKMADWINQGCSWNNFLEYARVKL